MNNLSVTSAGRLKLSDLEIAKQNRESMASGFDRQGQSFVDFLQQSMTNVDASQKTADKMAVDLASGKTETIHETMLALSQAELTFNFMVQVRNKVLESYQEVMRMQV